MADRLSQNDLDALWASNSHGDAKNAEPGGNSASGISQGDLDALFTGLGGPAEDDAALEGNGSTSEGLSQGDLDALWGGLTPTAGSTERAASIKVESACPIGENLSQDDIDRLLADMGR